MDGFVSIFSICIHIDVFEFKMVSNSSSQSASDHRFNVESMLDTYPSRLDIFPVLTQHLANIVSTHGFNPSSFATI